MYLKGRAWIELNKENLLHNIHTFRRILPESCRIMPAVKANAYGHGAVLVSKLLEEAGIRDYCVASVQEGVELREAGIQGQILVLGYTHPELLPQAVQYDLTQTVVDADYARMLGAFGERVKVHIGIDTGMHRLGEWYGSIEEIKAMWNISNLNITGIFSHLCVADSRKVSDREYTLHQIAAFRKVIGQLHEAGITGFTAHLLSSYGVFNYPEFCFDYARIGIALYGILSSADDEADLCPDLLPVLSLKARVQTIRELKEGEKAGYGLAYTAPSLSRIATLSIGYADGIPRSLSNTGYVLIGGCRAPVIGRICMDQMLVDVTHADGVQAGCEAVLIGKSGEEEITASQFAFWTDTITNEILSRLGSRLTRMTV